MRASLARWPYALALPERGNGQSPSRQRAWTGAIDPSDERTSAHTEQKPAARRSSQGTQRSESGATPGGVCAGLPPWFHCHFLGLLFGFDVLHALHMTEPSGRDERSAFRPSTDASLPEGGRVVAITGSASFLGTHLIGILEDSPRVAKIISLDEVPPKSAGPKTHHHSVDLTHRRVAHHLSDLLAAERADTVVHLAFHDNPTHRPQESHYLESVGTMQIVLACRRANVRKFVLWSHTFLYGAHPHNPSMIDETRPLYSPSNEPFFRDKLQAERDALEFGLPGRGRTVTILRTAPIVGTGIDGFATRLLTQPRVVTILGFDPLWQFLHESDAVLAFKRAVDADIPGIFNISGGGVIPLSKAVRLVGGRNIPLTRPLAHLALRTGWVLRRSPLPETFVDYLQYSCAADTERSRRQLGFVPMFSSHEALLDFASRRNMRQVELISETPV
jgi:UDP-glucose 4-epimerase